MYVMDVFTALAEPTRRQILEMLAAKGKLSASDITEQFRVSAPAISQHLKVLKEADLVSMEKRAQQRIYSINPKPLIAVQEWIQKMQSLWEERLESLQALLKEATEKEQ